jgi:alpha-beta hydrolase superfamily lysophospholipase
MMLHGLTDSPYSLSHIARRYREHGFVVVAIRLPGHGTVPAGLINVRWESWTAATQLAANEARRRVPSPAPFHIVGFSNGGALAMQYALNSLGKESSMRPDRIVLISPMIGITRFARLAGLAELPALLPSFAKSAWLGIVPEFNPFKYNSFPVNGARQSKRLTVALQQQINRMAANNALNEMPPVLTFQSVMDNTVSTPAIISNLYAYLPPNGSELVLFDVNRSVKFSALLRNRSNQAMARAMPPLPQDYRLTIIGNSAPGNSDTVARVFEPGATEAQVRALNLPYPADIFSLSHVAIPFPMDDPLYGMTPRANAEDEFGIALGAINARGERGALVINLDSMFRIASNPFFPYMLERLDENIGANRVHAAKSPATVNKIVRAPGGQKLEKPEAEDMKREEQRELQELGPLFAP